MVNVVEKERFPLPVYFRLYQLGFTPQNFDYISRVSSKNLRHFQWYIQ